MAHNSNRKNTQKFRKIARIDPSTPTHAALHYALEEFKRPRGRPAKM